MLARAWREAKDRSYRLDDKNDQRAQADEAATYESTD
jgi:hypothetical protein